ncbi:acetyl-CoA carboxylase biotin carboxylase subunit [Arthrobacter woluwensis]|nr:acetyl-CoA carboxylase biotin carboxylase subunit [Arthrobacter woluwensis]
MKKLFIANRGEIAVRIIKTAREMGITTVLGVSVADEKSFAARLADEAAVLGPAPAAASYLNQEATITAAIEHGCDALHPGYGFLSENAGFARKVISSGLAWVGPSAEAIDLMGDKAQARRAAEAAGVPVLAGTKGPLAHDADPVEAARAIGYPLLVKAAAGGGGRGIRRVNNESELLEIVELARGEAAANFGDPSVYLERFVESARHIEVQLLSDGHTFLHLGDRDCSMQRRSQKVIEEAPAPGIPEHVRDQMRSSSVELARQCSYSGAGTVEFLYDPVREEAAFIEMNTRLQVEHPITELITGIDLVKEQLKIAGGENLPFTQADITFTGHAIECRINAEDPARGFFPSPGKLTALSWPAGNIRVDAGVEEGDVIAPFYDSMIAKLISYSDTRESAIRQAVDALKAAVIEGVKTTVPVHITLLETPEFQKINHNTTFIERNPELLDTLSQEEARA